MTEAYATLANHGKHGTYTMIERSPRRREDHRRCPNARTRQAVSRQAADTTTSVLQSVVENGTATAAQTSGRPAAGKTGTAEEDTAAWFAGYTPDLATVVAVMGQDPVTAGHKSLYGALGLPRMNGGGATRRDLGPVHPRRPRGRPRPGLQSPPPARRLRIPAAPRLQHRPVLLRRPHRRRQRHTGRRGHRRRHPGRHRRTGRGRTDRRRQRGRYGR